MNILVVSLVLLSNIGESFDQNTILTINEIYLVGQFDAILLLTDEKTLSEKDFSFAKIYKWHIPNSSNLDSSIDAILISLEQIAATVGGNCLFTVLCANDSFVTQIAQKTRPNNNICFMLSSNTATINTFAGFPLPTQDNQYGYNFFMEKMTEYITRNNGQTYRNTSMGKINELKWVHIYWIGKPPSYTFVDQK
ncbi:MAG: hypothetical protein LBQ23_00025 [Puniceicoccales bacterium]|jgi:hypothetical protein|nr:hypothetical protein [Puniceicoccales bacterium]